MHVAPSSVRRFNFPDAVETPSRAEPTRHAEKPEKPIAGGGYEDLCPYCQRALPGPGSNVVGLLQLGLKQLLGAIFMIVIGIVRCARFAVAGVLCLLGLIGSCCFGLASRIAHRDDRKLLFRK